MRIQTAPFFRGVSYREDADSSMLQRGKFRGVSYREDTDSSVLQRGKLQF